MSALSLEETLVTKFNSSTELHSRVFCASIYHLATPALAMLARAEAIYKAEKFSDHAPITVDYDFKL